MSDLCDNCAEPAPVRYASLHGPWMLCEGCHLDEVEEETPPVGDEDEYDDGLPEGRDPDEQREEMLDRRSEEGRR